MIDTRDMELENSRYMLKRASALLNMKSEYITRLEMLVESLAPQERLEYIVRTKWLENPIKAPNGTLVKRIFRTELTLKESEVGVMDEI